MRRKVRTVKKKIGNDTMLNFFNQMTGVKDIDPTLIEGKYEGYISHIEKFTKVWQIFLDSPFCRQVLIDSMPVGVCEIKNFVDSANKFLGEITLPIEKDKISTKQEPLLEGLFSLGSKYNAERLNEKYRQIKKSDVLKHIVNTLYNIDTLLRDDKNRSGNEYSCLDFEEKISNDFILNTQLDTKILSFSEIDFKHLYARHSDIIGDFNKLVLLLIRRAYFEARDIYKLFMSPDIDIEKFAEAFVEKIDETKKVIKGCDKAFNQIKKSVHMLKNNFSTYYKDFMTTNNPSVIFESFLKDVAEKNKNSITLMAQFRKITNFIRSKMSGEIKTNPEIAKLWSYSDKLFEKFEENNDDGKEEADEE